LFTHICVFYASAVACLSFTHFHIFFYLDCFGSFHFKRISFCFYFIYTVDVSTQWMHIYAGHSL